MLEIKQGELDTVELQLSKVRIDAENLTKSLTAKEDIVTSLNATITSKSEEVEGLYKVFISFKSYIWP